MNNPIDIDISYGGLSFEVEIELQRNISVTIVNPEYVPSNPDGSPDGSPVETNSNVSNDERLSEFPNLNAWFLNFVNVVPDLKSLAIPLELLSNFDVTLNSYDELKAYSGVHNTVRVFPTSIVEKRLPGIFKYVTESPLNVPIELLDEHFYNRPPIGTITTHWSLPNTATINNNRLELVNYLANTSNVAASIDLDIPISTIGTKYIVYYEVKVVSGSFRVTINTKSSSRAVTASGTYIDEIVTDTSSDNIKLFIKSSSNVTASIFNIRVDMILDADDAIVFRSSQAKGSGYWVKELGESISINHYDISNFLNDKPVRNLLAVSKKLNKVALFDNTSNQLALEKNHIIECDIDSVQGLPGSDSLVVNYLNGEDLFSISIDEFDFFKRAYLTLNSTYNKNLHDHLILKRRKVVQITAPSNKITYTKDTVPVERWCAAFKIYDPEHSIGALNLFFEKNSSITPSGWTSKLYYAYVKGDNLLSENSGNFLVHCYEEITDYTILYGINHTLDGVTGNGKNATIEQLILNYTTLCIRSQAVEQKLVEAGNMGPLPTMRTKIFRLPSIKSYKSRHPIHDADNNTSAIVFKQCRTLTVDFLNVKFCKYAITLQGSNSIDSGEGFAFNTILFGALLNNKSHIRLVPSINRGDGVSEIGQSGTFVGGYTNQNFMQGGNITNNAQYLDDDTLDYDVVCNVNTEIYTAVIQHVYTNNPQVGDIFEFLVSGRKAEIIDSVTIGATETTITFTYNQDVEGLDFTTVILGRIRYANREGYSILEGYSNVARIVGRPDGNVFINTAFEDRGLVGKYLINFNGVRRTTLLNCRYEVGQAYDNGHIRRPAIYLNGCDYNMFYEGTGLDERVVTIGEYKAYSNTFLSAGNIKYNGGIPSSDRNESLLKSSDFIYENGYLVSNKNIISIDAGITISALDNNKIFVATVSSIVINCNSNLGAGFNFTVVNKSGGDITVTHSEGNTVITNGVTKEVIFITTNTVIFK